MKQACERDHGAGRVLGSLQDQRTTGGESRYDLANCQVEWKVPRGECSAHAHRLANHQLPYVVVARWNDASIDAAAFLCMPFGMLGAAGHLVQGFGQWLALI